MAVRDALGVLNGALKVASAVCSTVSVDVQRAMKSSTLLPGVSQKPLEEFNWDSFGANSFTYLNGLTNINNDSNRNLQEPFPVTLANPPGAVGEVTDGMTGLPFMQASTPFFDGLGLRKYHTFARHRCPGTIAKPRTFHTAVLLLDTTTRTGDSPTSHDPQGSFTTEQKLSSRSKERAVPASRIGRMASFGGLVAGLGIGTAAEVAKRVLEGGEARGRRNALLTEANIERIVNTLCRVRGAALKFGQMLSMEDGSFLPPEVQEAFERVRNNADYMPTKQMKAVLDSELGPNWRLMLSEFDDKPLAAASIGQVHKGVLLDGREVAIKIQYPGVAQSINSDIDNIVTILQLWNVVPEGLFLEATAAVARRELEWETDYIREAECCERFRKLLESDPYFVVPHVVKEMSSKHVITTDLVHGVPLDRCKDLDQDERNMIAMKILTLCMRELFEFRFMQTDPNWSNFFYNKTDKKLYLLDFGASREYPKKFADNFLRVVHGAATHDRDEILRSSKDLGFLTGYESKTLIDVHVEAVTILGEHFSNVGQYDFGAQDSIKRIHKVLPILLKHRLTPPPDESYSVQRKWAGAFLLCARLGAVLDCKPIFDQIYSQYKFLE
ncbi:hypothetical protein EMCRGX_G032422 [Ephydatia muelleri]